MVALTYRSRSARPLSCSEGCRSTSILAAASDARPGCPSQSLGQVVPSGELGFLSAAEIIGPFVASIPERKLESSALLVAQEESKMGFVAEERWPFETSFWHFQIHCP